MGNDLPPPKAGDEIKIRYQVGETGWAEYLGDLKAKILNISFDGNLDVNDIVSLKWDGDWLAVDEVLEPSGRTTLTIRYDEISEVEQLVPKLEELGCSVEGGLTPSERGRGLLMVGAPSGVDPIQMARDMGIANPAE